MKRLVEQAKRRLRRKRHVRKRVSGTGERPRMSVFKSNRHMYVQVINDDEGKTIASASNLEKELLNIKNNVKDAEKLGEIMGTRLKEKKVERIVFDRNGFVYHGIVKAIAEGVRKAGIQI